MARKKLTPQYDQVFGTMKVSRGKTEEGTQLFSWDALIACSGTDCPAASRCDYLNGEQPDRCQVMLKYLKSVSQVIMDNYREALDDGQLYRVGMHVVPLYRNLCRLKIYEMGVRDVIYTDDKGKRFLDPVYKEIREYIKLLEQMWKSVGIASPSISQPDDDMFRDGDNYYEQMEKEAMADIHKERGRRLSVVRRTKEN